MLSDGVREQADRETDTEGQTAKLNRQGQTGETIQENRGEDDTS